MKQENVDYYSDSFVCRYWLYNTKTFSLAIQREHWTDTVSYLHITAIIAPKYDFPNMLMLTEFLTHK